MNLNHLSIFHAVASRKSISGGAQQLHISQSAVSKQLGEFERTLGVMLFDRLPRGVSITEAGKLLQGYANRLFALEAEAEAAIGDLQSLARGRLTIGASRTIGGYLLPPILAKFRQHYPGVELTMQVENTATIESRLIAGEIDIGFVEGIVSSDLLEYHVFANDELVLIAEPKHPLTKQAPVPPATVVQYPIVTLEVGSGTRLVTERAFASKKLAIRPAMSLASTEAIKQTVATGAGVAVLSSFAIKREVAAKALVVVPIKGLSIQRPLYRVQLKSSWASPALTAFVGLLPK